MIKKWINDYPVVSAIARKPPLKRKSTQRLLMSPTVRKSVHGMYGLRCRRQNSMSIRISMRLLFSATLRGSIPQRSHSY
jgi:hypothetical protein